MCTVVEINKRTNKSEGVKWTRNYRTDKRQKKNQIKYAIIYWGTG